jgi:hypothetical protein
MSVTSRIDDPEDQCIRKPACTIRGWCSSDKVRSLKGLQFFIGEWPVRHSTQRRPDVEAACAGMPSAGFLIRLDLNFYLQAVEDNELVMRLVVPGEEPLPFRFRVARGVVASCLAAVGGA